MATDNSHAPENEIDSLTPLPLAHRQGLWGVSILAGLSFVSSTVLLVYLTVKLIRWHIKQWKLEQQQSIHALASSSVDLSLGLAERHLFPPCRRNNSRGRDDPDSARKKAYPNQFLVLIYNLLLADIHQAGAFLLNAVWLGKDGIIVHTPACWAQGWLVSTGDLSSSCFITAIAVHTYLAVVRNYTPPQCAVYATVIGLWVFNYLMAALGVILTKNGADGGGLYVRAAAWCWINIQYETHRLFLHYLWIFISLFLTSALYAAVFLSLRKKTKELHSESKLTRRPTAAYSNTKNKPLPALPPSSSHNQQQKAFLLYPLIYILCTLPLALGRITTMAGVHVPISYFCTAGALIASNGWLDVLLWGVTRHRLIFTSEGIDTEASGIESFGAPPFDFRGSGIIRTPAGRKFGNMVWVQAGNCNKGEGEKAWGKRKAGLGRMGSRGKKKRNKTASQETLTRMMGRSEGAGGPEEMGKNGTVRGIQMDTVTSVTVLDVVEDRIAPPGQAL
ncbi:G protein-coupled glucose receptor regulating Gpa2-domain-containing protein [Triangularia setosa]|uniref:G protein-coupled glucose receptor regulating Gpa2-domain-containing protein n=1 Tax=Triangularia setosa TaxID=2587417 RepID=A0AAN6W6E9_9PEZI|nr:G protein-coupled glucose receptor regulating Gpa2-domain-containing protein [Podospora setosa]